MSLNILFNVNIAGYKKGAVIPYDTAPAGPRHWVDGKHILVETQICTLVDAYRRPVVSGAFAAIETFDFFAVISDELIADQRRLHYQETRCAGIKKDGTRCKRMATCGRFCKSHVGQAKDMAAARTGGVVTDR